MIIQYFHVFFCLNYIIILRSPSQNHFHEVIKCLFLFTCFPIDISTPEIYHFILSINAIVQIIMRFINAVYMLIGYTSLQTNFLQCNILKSCFIVKYHLSISVNFLFYSFCRIIILNCNFIVL